VFPTGLNRRARRLDDNEIAEGHIGQAGPNMALPRNPDAPGPIVAENAKNPVLPRPGGGLQEADHPYPNLENAAAQPGRVIDNEQINAARRLELQFNDVAQLRARLQDQLAARQVRLADHMKAVKTDPGTVNLPNDPRPARLQGEPWPVLPIHDPSDQNNAAAKLADRLHRVANNVDALSRAVRVMPVNVPIYQPILNGRPAAIERRWYGFGALDEPILPNLGQQQQLQQQLLQQQPPVPGGAAAIFHQRPFPDLIDVGGLGDRQQPYIAPFQPQLAGPPLMYAAGPNMHREIPRGADVVDGPIYGLGNAAYGEHWDMV
jgi:hypothetical protein